MKKLCHRLTSIPFTIVSGVFLLVALIEHLYVEFLPISPAWVTIIISGIPLVYLAVTRIIHNRGISKISSALLISIAMVAAIIIGDEFAAGEVAFIMAVGEILEDLTTERAKRGLYNLISLSPTKARRLNGTEEEMISADEIKTGDILRVLPGESVPADGIIVSGETSIDQSVMTGESLPVDKSEGDNVFCGTVNRFGAVDIRATSVGEDSSLEKLIRLVREAEGKKAPIQRIADKWASYLVPAALLLAIIAGIVNRNIVSAVTILVVFCPCALVLATPTAIMAAIGQATKRGVIIKSGEALEKMGKADIIAFDKTGTLTKGKPTVSDIVVLDSTLTEEELIMLAASAEKKSEHPLGKAIVERAKEFSHHIPDADEFKMEAGLGISATVNGRELICASANYLEKKGISLTHGCEKALEMLRADGKASVICAADGKLIGVIGLSDVLRENAAETVEKLHSLGCRTVLLTGDNEAAAAYFASSIGIDDVRASLLPEDKASAILELEKNGTVCMIGDGVNDAPALKSASVGTAMGTVGSDIAIEAADIALMGDDLSKIPYLKKLANITSRTIKISISMSLIINFAAIVLSFLNILTPTTGALVHNAGSVLVVLFAALLYDKKINI